jgi:hypothetical protein
MKTGKSPTTYGYAEPSAFERLMLLIATLVQHPGVGGSGKEVPKNNKHRDALQEVLISLQKVAHAQGFLPPQCSVHTLRKDLETLRYWGILEQRMYRWGYYLGTGGLNRKELQAALNALACQAIAQQDPQMSKIYHTVSRKLKGMELSGDLFYPVRTQLDRVIIHTEPEELIAKGLHKYTLFHALPVVEKAILRGEAIEIYHNRNPYAEVQPRYFSVYPLQLIYSDIAWYLLHEDINNGHLAVTRVDRLSDHCRILEFESRDITSQRNSLKVAHRLLESGWGIYLGNNEEQKLECSNQLQFAKVTVRFFPPVLDFILEGERRHPSQKIRKGAKANGKLPYVDYTVQLPPRSFNSFSQWIYRFMGQAKVLDPPELVEKHRKAAQELIDRYFLEN